MSTQTAPTPPSAHPPAPQPRPDGAHDDRNDARAPVSGAAAAATHDADRGASGGGGGKDPSGAPSGAPYPPQTHAGKAGLGPHYYEQHRATLQDKVHGLREVLEGHIKHDEKLQQVRSLGLFIGRCNF